MVDNNKKENDINFLREFEVSLKRRLLINLILITRQILDLYKKVPKSVIKRLPAKDHLRCISMMEEAVKGDDLENLELVYITMEKGVDILYRLRDHLRAEEQNYIESN